ncbi:MAG: hypothetical protein IJ532_01065 [Alphaproteobacteria bacterium]|nr:hypothetical protein [Alphaproteobacteria bacterium]
MTDENEDAVQSSDAGQSSDAAEIAAEEVRTAKDIVTDSSQQMFDNFVSKNFDEEQQREIYGQIDTAIQENNGNCTITWQGEDKKDKVEVTYVNGRMTKFEMNNRTVTEDFNASQHIEYKEKKHSVKVVSKEKHNLDGSTNKWKCSVKANDDNSFRAKNSRTVSHSETSLTQHSSSAVKESRKVKSENNGYSDKYTTTSANLKIGEENKFSVKGHSETLHYNENGEEIKRTGSDNLLSVGSDGVQVFHANSSQHTIADGSTITSQKGIGVTLNEGMVTVSGGTQNTITDEYGNTLYNSERIASVGVGNGIAGSYHRKKETPQETIETTFSADVHTGHIKTVADVYHRNDDYELRKRLSADFNAYKRCIDVQHKVQRSSDGQYSEQNTALNATVNSKSGTITYKKENVYPDGSSSSSEVKGSVYVQGLSHTGVSITQTSNGETHNLMKLDTQKAYNVLDGMSNGVLSSVEQVISNIENVKNSVSNTVQTAQNTINQNPVNRFMQSSYDR